MAPDRTQKSARERANPLNPQRDGKTPPYPPLAHRCSVNGCLWSFARPSDLKRHDKRHLPPKEKVAQNHHCTYPNCPYNTTQLSNLKTHFRTHTGEKSEWCPDCEFTTSDPGSLTNHRKKRHGYKPRATQHIRAAAPLLSTDASLASAGSASLSPTSGDSTAPWRSSAPSPPSCARPSSSPSPPAHSASSGYGSHFPSQAFHLRYPPPPSSSSLSTPSSTASWSGNMLFDTASGTVFHLADAACMRVPPAFAFVGPHPTRRPGPTGLYPADNSHFHLSTRPAQLPPLPPWAISEQELSAIIAEAAGLDPISAPPSFPPFAYHAQAQSYTAPDAAQYGHDHGFALEFSFEREDPMAYHVHGELTNHLHGELDTWTGVPQH
ncbi:hypothetical protein DFH08DRAFT_985481 [Mycena albidolilacea]|uniref:C2H2-type domain-containing protein n=1 Tax=Mycena albidolilacea TaxID=1033008 RepID=A0AAD7EVV7_9AGAR|nr:hypothetical protein DFH08DRAFT_985481 [Mycena albidolilacea]